LCPDRCGHSGKLATFEIIRYVSHEKPGEHGDPKQGNFQILIGNDERSPKVPAAVREAILALKPGEVVDLNWNHDYVTRDGASFPERPVVKLAIRAGEADAKAGD
jgi:hypothetical protein